MKKTSYLLDEQEFSINFICNTAAHYLVHNLDGDTVHHLRETCYFQTAGKSNLPFQMCFLGLTVHTVKLQVTKLLGVTGFLWFSSAVVCCQSFAITDCHSNNTGIPLLKLHFLLHVTSLQVILTVDGIS